MVDFGAKLKNLRVNKGLSQPQLAELLGLTRSVISAYETGIRYPSHDILVRIAYIFGVSTDFLLGKQAAQSIDIGKLTEEQVGIIVKLISEFEQLNKKAGTEEH